MAAHPRSHSQSLASPSDWRRRLLITLALLLALLLLVAPMAAIFAGAFAKGLGHWASSLAQPDTLKAIGLSLLTLAAVLPLNVVYGLVAGWALTKFRFRGKKWLIALIETPFSVSPIVAGVALLLVYGNSGLLGPWLDDHDIKVMFALPGIILATLFITSPYVIRELLPLMQTQGIEDEEAARILGASGWHTFLHITLPNIRWALFYGIVLCAARALGEFGAVSVVSGQIRGETNTLPLQIDLLYHDYDSSAAFAAASALMLMSLVTLIAKLVMERRHGSELGRGIKENAED